MWRIHWYWKCKQLRFFLEVNSISYIVSLSDFFVKNQDGSVLTHWWNSDILQAQHVDFSNSEAREWFASRLRKLRNDHGIDGFKFDAGETTFAPQVYMNFFLEITVKLQQKSR